MNVGIYRCLAIAFAAFGLMFSSASAMARAMTMSGTVTYRERIALPPSAVVEVKILDVSLADAPSTTIASTTMRIRRQVPIRYRLRFDSSNIRPGHRYALRAQITVAGQLWFTSTTHQPVLSGGADNTDIVVQRVSENPRADAATTARPVGRWLAENIRGGGVIDRLQTVLEIAADGAISGTGGCNRMTGKASIEGDKITFGRIASTMMACTPAAMNQEQKFFAALAEVRTWRIDPTRRKLALLGADGQPLVVLAKM